MRSKILKFIDIKYFVFIGFVTGKKWFERRKIITPAFHFKILEQFVEVFDRLGNIVVTKNLTKYDREDEFELYPVAVLYALDVMCGKLFFGKYLQKNVLCMRPIRPFYFIYQ